MNASIHDMIRSMYKLKGAFMLGENPDPNDLNTFRNFVNSGRQLFDKSEWGLSSYDSICSVASGHQSSFHYVLGWMSYNKETKLFDWKYCED